jgi:hypothetical protein
MGNQLLSAYQDERSICFLYNGYVVFVGCHSYVLEGSQLTMKKSKTLRIKDINEASYYALFGAKMVSVERHRLATKKSHKVGFEDQWIVTMSDVIPWLAESWKQGVSYGNITEFVNVRTKLKGKIKRELGISR